MPISMRRATALRKRGDKREARCKEQREQSVKLLRDGIKVSEVMRATGLSRGTVGRIKGTLKRIMAQIAVDGRKSFSSTSCLLSDEAVRAWRARSSEVTYRKAKNKNSAKLHAERYEHVESYSEALRNIDAKHLGIFMNSNRLWNMDETAICAETGHETKGFSSMQNHHGRFRGQRAGKTKKYITAVVVVSESDCFALPLFIVSGKHVMRSWFEPLTATECSEDPRLQWMTRPSWMPDDAVVLMSENGSNDKS
eukprot:IDg5441t1